MGLEDHSVLSLAIAGAKAICATDFNLGNVNIGIVLAAHLSASINGQNIVADSGKTVAALGETVIRPTSISPMVPF